MIIILLGLPGSGKGTQGKRLANSLNISHISTGDILRKMADGNDKEAKSLNDYMSHGKLIPDDLMNKVVAKYLSTVVNNSCLLDGYPRNLLQAEFLSTVIDNRQIQVIYFNIEDDVALARISGRFICKDCGKIYNDFNLNPKVHNICDVCGSMQFIRRLDDATDTVSCRIKEYHLETYPLIDYYIKQGNLHSIDANKGFVEITMELEFLLKNI